MAKRITQRKSVLAACAEYDRLGRERFLETYGFGANTRWVVRIGRVDYDSGVAYGYEHSGHGPLRHEEFNGGIGSGAAAWQLKQLGFEVVETAVR